LSDIARPYAVEPDIYTVEPCILACYMFSVYTKCHGREAKFYDKAAMLYHDRVKAVLPRRVLKIRDGDDSL